MNTLTRSTAYKHIPVIDVLVNPEQPRKLIDPDELLELTESIRQHGVIKPIAVEEAPTETGSMNYILHDGERRWRASVKAGNQTIPAIIMPPLNGTGPQERLERALVANIQHSPMSPVDDALAIARLRKEYRMSNRTISKRIGKAETWISTRLRLAELEPEILNLMRCKKLSTEDKAVRALMSIVDSRQRVQIAKALAERKATANMIQHACREFLKFGAERERQGHRRYTRPAATLATDAVNDIKQNHLPEWDALFQLGKVPPYPMLNDVVMRTCDSCALRSMASPEVCGQCALVCALNDLMRTVATEAVLRA